MAKKSSEKSDSPPKKSRAEIGRFARNKGKRGELKVVERFRTLWNKVERVIQDRGGKSDGPDVIVPEAGLDIEVKHRNVSAIRPAIKDAQANCRPGNSWVAIDWPTIQGTSPTITMDLDEWIELILRERESATKLGFDAGRAHAIAEQRAADLGVA